MAIATLLSSPNLFAMRQMLLALLLSAAPAAHGANVTLTTLSAPAGSMRGIATSSYRMFAGVPYAEPPVGARRWRAPTPRAPWSGVRDTLSYGSSCVQPTPFDPAMGAQSEDCLFLNVYAPPLAASNAGAAAAVLVWFHGGSFLQGGGHEERLNGTYLVTLLKRRLVVVTINYRLGVFGFSGAAALRGRNPGSRDTGNYGLQDQREALRWVSKNIAAFGGDPTRVFAAGQSAGAGSVTAHLVMPKSWGLFQRAGMESGAFAAWGVTSMASAEAAWAALASNLKCDHHPRSASTSGSSNSSSSALIACMEKKPAAEVLAAVPSIAAYGPTIDGVELADAPWVLAAQGKLAPGVPIIAGAAAEDGDSNSLSATIDAPALAAWLRTTMLSYGANETTQNAVAKAYAAAPPPLNASRPGEGFDRFYWSAKHMLADSEMLCPARRIARWVAAAGAGARERREQTPRGWVYQFRYAAPASCGAGMGAKHSVEIPFVFHVLAGNEDQYHLHGAEEIALSATVAQMWANFAESGDPNGGGAPSIAERWPAFSNDNANVMLFDVASKGGVRHAAHFRESMCTLWDSIPQSETPTQ